MQANQTLRSHAAREHEHMLGCGFTYFKSYPEEWERVRGLPLEEGIAAMLAHYKAEQEGEHK